MTHTPTSPSATRPWPRAILGLALMLPAVFCCAGTLAWPSLQLVLMSFQRVAPFGPGAEFIGFDNYASLAALGSFARVLGFTALLAAERVVIAAIVPVLVGVGAAALSRTGGRSLRLLFALPLAFFGPLALAAAWAVRLAAAQDGSLGQPDSARGIVLLVDAAQTIGLAGARGALANAAALRGERAGGRSLLLIWLTGMTAAAASAVQTSALPMLLTAGGPATATTTLAMLQFQLGFVQARFGQAAAVAAPALIVVALLGLVVGLAIAVSNLRIAPHGASADRTRSGALVALAIGALLSLGWWAWGHLPLLSMFGGLNAETLSQLVERMPVGTVAVNSLQFSLLSVLIPLPVAYLAALGIGALRPAGRHSEWLLVPFSPWLFVSIALLLLPGFNNLRGLGLLNSRAALAPPILVSIPALFVLTLFFKGRHARWQAARGAGQSSVGAFMAEVVAPSLPLVVWLGLLTFVVSWQELMWPLTATSRAEFTTLPVLARAVQGQFGANAGALAAAAALLAWPVALLMLLAIGATHLALDGLAIRTDDE